MTEPQRRIAEQQRKSGINKLWDALTPLKHVGSFMNCGAHPDDERYQKLFGKNALTPLFDIKIPIIADETVENKKPINDPKVMV